MNTQPLDERLGAETWWRDWEACAGVSPARLLHLLYLYSIILQCMNATSRIACEFAPELRSVGSHSLVLGDSGAHCGGGGSADGYVLTLRRLTPWRRADEVAAVVIHKVKGRLRVKERPEVSGRVGNGLPVRVNKKLAQHILCGHNCNVATWTRPT